MKILALTLALLLHVSGLWPQLSAATRGRLSAAATADQAAPAVPIAPTTLPAAPITTLALPMRTGTDSLHLAASSSALVLDRQSATPLFTQAATQRRPIASLTKLVTALTILSRHQVTERVTVGQLPDYEPDAARLGLRPGEVYTLGDLVRAAIIPSAADAADALAIYDSGSTTKFVTQMNLTIARWGIKDTHFSNDTGLQDDNNYSTALALGQIAQLALTNSFIRQAAAQPTVTLTSATGRTLSDDNTNELLATGRFYGIKTGYTLAAGECFIGLTQIEGHDIITVILGSPDRFGETETMINWTKRNWQWL